MVLSGLWNETATHLFMGYSYERFGIFLTVFEMSSAAQTRINTAKVVIPGTSTRSLGFEAGKT